MLINRRSFEIPWGDCDAAGIVFYPRYFAWFDESTHLLFRAAGFRQVHQHFGILGIPMVDTRAIFRKPSSYGDEIVIETEIAAFRRSSFDVKHRLMRDGELGVEGFETRVWAVSDPEAKNGIRGEPIPQEVVEALSRT